MQSIEIDVRTGRDRGFSDLTPACARFAAEASAGGDGLLSVFVPHATAGVVILELGAGSDTDALHTLDRLLPRDDRWTHRHGSHGHGADHVLPLLARRRSRCRSSRDGSRSGRGSRSRSWTPTPTTPPARPAELPRRLTDAHATEPHPSPVHTGTADRRRRTAGMPARVDRHAHAVGILRP